MAFVNFLLFLLVVFGVIGGVVHYFTDFGKRVKYSILIALALGWLAIAAYSYYQNQKRIYHDMLYYHYKQGETLVCKAPFGAEVEVDRTRFDFISGTLVFVGREGTPYEGLVVPLEECRLKEERGSHKQTRP